MRASARCCAATSRAIIGTPSFAATGDGEDQASSSEFLHFALKLRLLQKTNSVATGLDQALPPAANKAHVASQPKNQGCRFS